MGIADRLALGRQQHARFFQSIHHAPVRITPLAVLIDDAGTFKTGRILGVIAIGVDGGRNWSANFFRPDIVVISTMAGSGVDKACTRIISDMIAIEERNRKVVTLWLRWMITNQCQSAFTSAKRLSFLNPCPLSALHPRVCQQ